MNTPIKVSDVLKLIKKDPIKTMGICPNFDRLGIRFYYDNEDLIETFDLYKDHFFKTFSRYSGNINYPVKSPFKCKTSEEVFRSKMYYWTGPYGKDRKLLLDHLIKCFEEIGE